MTAIAAGITLMYSIFVFLMCSLITMVVLYISELQYKMNTMNIENAKLLDGMHEGLLILTKSDPQTPMFCNKTAQKLLKGTMNHWDLTQLTEDVDSNRKNLNQENTKLMQ